MQPIHPRCFFIALIAAWVLAIYLPSLVIAAAGLSPLAAGRNLAVATLDVADEVAPAAKIGFALLLSLLLYARRRWPALPAVPADVAIGGLAMSATVAFLPQAWSRGFGIGIAGNRFDPVLLAIYLSCAALAGLVFHFSEKRCLRRAGDQASNA